MKGCQPCHVQPASQNHVSAIFDRRKQLEIRAPLWGCMFQWRIIYDFDLQLVSNVYSGSAHGGTFTNGDSLSLVYS